MVFSISIGVLYCIMSVMSSYISCWCWFRIRTSNDCSWFLARFVLTWFLDSSILGSCVIGWLDKLKSKVDTWYKHTPDWYYDWSSNPKSKSKLKVLPNIAKKVVEKNQGTRDKRTRNCWTAIWPPSSTSWSNLFIATAYERTFKIQPTAKCQLLFNENENCNCIFSMWNLSFIKCAQMRFNFNFQTKWMDYGLLGWKLKQHRTTPHWWQDASSRAPCLAMAPNSDSSGLLMARTCQIVPLLPCFFSNQLQSLFQPNSILSIANDLNTKWLNKYGENPKNRLFPNAPPFHKKLRHAAWQLQRWLQRQQPSCGRNLPDCSLLRSSHSSHVF